MLNAFAVATLSSNVQQDITSPGQRGELLGTAAVAQQARMTQMAQTSNHVNARKMGKYCVAFGGAIGLALATAARRNTKSGKRFVLAATLTQSDEAARSDANAGNHLPLESCVKIWVSGASPSYLLPWQVTQQEEWTGSAFAVLVGGKWRLLTNAHVVDGGLRVRVSQQSKSQKIEAKVLAIAHDLDLALLDVPDLDFQKAVPPVELAEGLPSLFMEVEAIGYPQGGTTICVTKGVVSRVDAQLYAHPAILGIRSLAFNCPGKLLIVQIDAAINPGNSGGPALDKSGKVLGVASSGLDGGQNIGYIIPSCVVERFIDEVVETGTWGGIADPGFKVRVLESDPLRQFLQVPDGRTGVQITSVAPLGALAPDVKVGDVLLKIDGQDISNEGTVLLHLPSGQDVQLDFEYLLTSKSRGQETSLSILTPGGDEREITVVFEPIPALLPRYHGFDAKPSYFIIGGFVFTRLSTPLLLELSVPASLLQKLRTWRNDTEEVVILQRVLQNSVNEGVEASSVRVLQDINGTPITTMDGLVTETMRIVASGKEDFLRFCFLEMGKPGGEAQTEVLVAKDVLSADAAILGAYRIPAPVSVDLAGAYRAHAPTDVPCVKEWLRTLEKTGDVDDSDSDEDETDEQDTDEEIAEDDEEEDTVKVNPFTAMPKKRAT